MDPRACFERIMSAHVVADDAEITAAMADLLLWLLKQGAAPVVSSRELEELDVQMNALVDRIASHDVTTVEG